jgi:hypothetical protein
MSARVDHRNLRMLCRLLVDSLESSECVLTQYGLVRIVIDTAEPGKETIAVRNITEATLDAAFKWLTRARSAEELEKLCSASCHCTRTSSNMDYARAHERGRQLMEGNSVTGSVLIWGWILHPFTRQPPIVNDEEDFRQIHLLSRRITWPRSTTSMLPHGPERTIHAFCLLFRTRIRPSTGDRGSLYTALEWIVKLCHPLITRLLVRSTIFQRWVVEEMVETPVPVRTRNDEQIFLTVSRVVSVRAFVQTMIDFTLFALDETERMAFVNQDPTLLLRVYARCLEVCEAARALVNLSNYRDTFSAWGLSLDRIEGAALGLQSLGSQLYDDCPSARNANIPEWIRRSFLATAICNSRDVPSSIQVWQRVVLAMHNLEVRQRCTAPECIKTRADGRLRVCAQCQRVPYCSRACQKAAWAHAIAHRDVCKSIAVLCDAYAIPKLEVYHYRPPNGAGDTARYEKMGLQMLEHFVLLTKFNMVIPSSKRAYSSRAFYP